MEVELGYRRKDSVEMVRSTWVKEDQKYVYLASGRYVKHRIVSMRTLATDPDFDPDEE